MEARTISFGNERSVTFRAGSSIPVGLEDQLVEYRVIEDRLYLLANGTQYALRAESDSQLELLEHLTHYAGHTLVRIDKLQGVSVMLTVFTYAGAAQFTGNESFTVVVNSAIELQLRNLRLPQTDLVRLFTKEFLCGDRCFALPGRGGNMDTVTLIGENLTCKIERTKQDIMQVVDIAQRRRNHYFPGAIVLLSGSIRFQDELNHTVQHSQETQKKFAESVKDNQELLRLWSLYSELELAAMKQEVNELGVLKYYAVDIVPDSSGKTVAVFKLDKRVPASFYTTGLGYAVIADEHYHAKDITASTRSLYIGDRAVKPADSRSSEHNELHVAMNSVASVLPSRGYVTGSFSGSKMMADRRQRALEQIDNCLTPLLDLKLLLQSGETVNEVKKKHYRPVNDELLKKIFGDKNITFTERQREAIDIAVNTPDLAIIQGPPGTGKTTVIRAIIARLEHLYNGNVKILVSSAQHDAVDNAIENVAYGGLPVNRLGGRSGEDETRSGQYIWHWIQRITQQCETFLEREEGSEYRAAFRRMLLTIEECKGRTEDRDLLKEKLLSIYRELGRLDLDPAVTDQVGQVISRLERNRIVEADAETSTADSNLTEKAEMFKLLESQRLSVPAFLDDGPIQLGRLTRFLRLCDSIRYEIPACWNSLRLGPESAELDGLLEQFQQSLDDLRSAVFGVEAEAVYTDESLLERDLDMMFKRILEELQLKAAETRDSLSNVIWEFKDELENPQNIADILDKYTRISAATCQQAVSRKAANLRINEANVYDYVIIDEAARANPLDLLIPMSLGKKIILVGDHNQLPHLLERDIVQELMRTKRDPRVADLLKETLFARLYTMLDRTKYTSHKRTVMLNDQYRMHPVIGDFVSMFYDEPLYSPLPKEAKLHQLGLYDDKPVAWIDVRLESGPESSSRHQSKHRDAEVDRVMSELDKILYANRDFTVGIITFYKSQATKIQERIDALTQQDRMRISAGTVDAFQGKEFDVVILSTVRANQYEDFKERVGFLDSRNRLCVAFSRGKRLLIVVGDAQTVASDGSQTIIKELNEFYELCKSEGYYE